MSSKTWLHTLSERGGAAVLNFFRTLASKPPHPRVQAAGGHGLLRLTAGGLRQVVGYLSSLLAAQPHKVEAAFRSLDRWVAGASWVISEAVEWNVHARSTHGTPGVLLERPYSS
jgi:hypothetical protein